MTPNKIIVDLEAIRHNFLELKRLAGASMGIIPVIKSDAYGHGMIAVAKWLEPERPDYFAVFEPAEGLALRQAGCRTPVLVMMGLEQHDIPAVVDANLTVALFDQALARELSRIALNKGRVVPAHIKVDTGMTRLGVPWQEVSSFLRPLVGLPGIRLEGIFSHFAMSDELGHPFTDEQMERFRSAVEQAEALGVCTTAVHVANSGAVLYYEAARHIGLVRPGITLYGSPPAAGLDVQCHLKPAMTFKSRVIQVKTVPAGTPVSYGSTYMTPGSATLATIPV
ncbi:MAG: alanine racemase, partial [Deltaproteobacteria bacterium]|nr:alanine racemase [Deltaproteobacteria bacterium]